MLLTVKLPLHNGILPPHEYAALPPPPPQHHSLAFARRDTPRVSSPAPLPVSASSALPTRSPTLDKAMDSSNRNLPSMSMTLAPPERGLRAMAPMSTSMSHLPAPPSQWQNTDEAMRQWLQTKAEEDRRKQEEERTLQEGYRLDQRKIEQSMLRESLKAGVPPYMVPLIFANMGGGANLQWTRQYMSQMPGSSPQPPPPSIHSSNIAPQPQPQPQPQHHPPRQQHHQQPQQEHHHQYQQQPQQHTPIPSQTAPSSNVHRHPPPPQTQPQSMPPPSQMPAAAQHVAPETPWDSRMIPSNPYAAQALLPTGVGPSSQSAPSSPSSHVSYGRATPLRPPTQPTGPPASTVASLARINTSEMPIQQPSSNAGVTGYTTTSPSASGSQQQSSSSLAKSDSETHSQSQRQAQPSPSIYFHHWVPPGQSQTNSPSVKSPNNSPHSSNSNSHLRSEYQSSPRKRKAQFVHQAVPPPPRSETATSQPSPGRTPPQGNVRSGGHLRHQNQSQSQVQEPRHGDLLEPGRPGGQMLVTSLVRSGDEGYGRSTSRAGSNSDRESTRERSSSGARFAGGRNGSSSHGNYPSGGSRHDSQSGPGGDHEQSSVSNKGYSSFSAYSSSYGNSHESVEPSNSGPGADSNNYRSPSDRSPIHSQEDHQSQQSTTA
ncbi:hypothetical protein ACJ72_01265 [Emergomyces africanus]|uniref:Uncharacterized protein n=1 Tax=Emergomyces africanus TaxID=1955775 RepID=A0A1B7P5U5_9EURO|nr:hypothetical protein ACJ72_01265 [Emergomyces africanus]